MQQFIDLHNHITWGVDDGISCFEDACKLLAMASEDRIVTIAATPHYIPGRYSKKEHLFITERMLEVKALADSYGIEVVFGSEIFLNQDYLQMIDDGLFHTIGTSKYILVEFDLLKDIATNDEVENQLYECIVRGYKVIIAHVERYFLNGIDLKRVKHWIDMGCYIQVNRTSILKLGTKSSYKNVKKLLNAGYVHLIASDAHQPTKLRVCKMSDVFKEIESHYSREYATLLCYENQRKVLNNEEMELIQVHPKKIFNIFR